LIGGNINLLKNKAQKIPYYNNITKLSDPYFTFQIKNQKVKSRVSNKSISPYFGNEVLMLCVTSLNESLIINCLHFENFKSENVLSSVTLNIHDYLNLENNILNCFLPDIKLFKKNLDFGGFLDINLKYDPLNH
jgi:Ca2+-dependent lipid-binding protein